MNSRFMRRLLGRMLLGSVLLCLPVGCGSSEPPPAPAQARDPVVADVPPAQMRQMLEGLQSDQARTQYAALQQLGRFPSVVRAHREHIERLATDGKDKHVRKKAAELLANLGE